MNIEEDLINEIIRGNKKAFKSFFYSYYPSLCLFAQRFIPSPELVEDIVQESFIEYWKNKEGFQSIDKAKGYLYTVVRNKCLNHIKHQLVTEKFRKINIDSNEFLMNNMIEEETYRIIHQAINGLAPQSKKIILLSLEGMTNKEIAETLKISINTVKTLKLRSYRSLREKLQKYIFIL